MSIFRCPECLGELVDVTHQLQCSVCKMGYPIMRGLPILARDKGFYYGEKAQPQIQSILERAAATDWRTAVQEFADVEGDTFLQEDVSSELRSGFKFLLDAFETGTVLDYGCGLGAITCGLARNFSTVLATDLTVERAQFTRLRAEQESLDNVIVFCSGDTPHVPLEDKSVDVIILSGVLEWVPESEQGKPRSIQVELLKELRRILKESGLLFIGIENRFGSGYLLGKREEHSRLRFVSLLPRRIADVYSHLVRGRAYRTYTYSRAGYRALLQDAGFRSTIFFGLISSYQHMHKAVSLSSRRMIRNALNKGGLRKSLRNLIVQPVLPKIVDAYGIVASNGKPVPYYERLLEHVSTQFLNGLDLKIVQYVTTSTGVVQLRISADSQGYYIKLPLSARAERRIESYIRNIQRLDTSLGSTADKLLRPKLVAHGKYRGQSFLVEEAMLGRSVEEVSAGEWKSLLPAICNYLVFLCKATRKPKDSWSQVLTEVSTKYATDLMRRRPGRWFPDELRPETLFTMIDRLRLAVNGGQGFVCNIHGDFWGANILATWGRKRAECWIGTCMSPSPSRSLTFFICW